MLDSGVYSLIISLYSKHMVMYTIINKTVAVDTVSCFNKKEMLWRIQVPMHIDSTQQTSPSVTVLHLACSKYSISHTS